MFDRKFGIIFVIFFIVNLALIGILIYGGIIGVRYVADNGVKNVIERIWEGPSK